MEVPQPPTPMRSSARRFRGIPILTKLRWSRGPLRFWLVVAGVFLVRIDGSRSAVGVVLVVLGTALHLFAKGTLRQNRELTVAGPYRFSRNPFYLANLLAESGLLVVIGNLWLASGYLTVWTSIYGSVIQDEEATLRRLFGRQYERYQARVPSLLPNPLRFLPARFACGPRFSFRNPNIAGGRELSRAARLLSYPLLLMAAGALRAHGWRYALDHGSTVVEFAGFATLNVAGFLVTWLLRRKRSSPPLKPAQDGSENDGSSCRVAAP